MALNYGRDENFLLKSFETLFASGKPRCGQIRDSQRELLFGSEANDIGSVALVPLGDKGSLGLLALGVLLRPNALIAAPILGGMITSTFLAVLFVPVFYVVFQGLSERWTVYQSPKIPT